MSLLAIVALGVVGLFAGFVNTVAGGGSALTVPVLMLTGLGADVANATNRVAILAQCASATRDFDRRGLLDRGAVTRVVPPMMAGAAGGAYFAAHIDPLYLEPVLLAAMIAVAAVMTFRPEKPAGETTAPPPVRGPLATVGLFAIGLYGGFIQAGVGLIMLGFLGALGHDLVRANALKAAVITLYTAIVLLIFVTEDLVRWEPAAALTIGNLLGTRAGVRFSIAGGEGPIRIIVFAMVVVTCIAALLR